MSTCLIQSKIKALVQRGANQRTRGRRESETRPLIFARCDADLQSLLPHVDTQHQPRHPLWRPWFARQSTTAPACPVSQATRTESLGGGCACPSRPSVAAPLRTRTCARGAAASAGAMLALHAGAVCLCAQLLDRAWLDLCQRGRGFSTYQTWSQLS